MYKYWKQPTNPLRLFKMINVCVTGVTESSGTHGHQICLAIKYNYFFLPLFIPDSSCTISLKPSTVRCEPEITKLAILHQSS